MSSKDVENFLNFWGTDFGEALMEKESELISNKFQECDKVLSLACGIGSLGGEIEDFEIVYLDTSLPMLLEAKERVGEAFVVQGDVENMPFKDGVFDCAYSVTGLEFLEDLDSAFGEIDRILSSEGRMLAMMLNPYSDYFKLHIEREGSYFRKIQYHPKQIHEYMKRYFSTEKEYFLGIEEDEIFTTKKPEEASLYVVSGEKM